MTCVKEILTLFLCMSTIANTLPINLQKVKKDVTTTVDSDDLASAETTVETYSSTVYTAVDPVFNVESSSTTEASASTTTSTSSTSSTSDSTSTATTVSSTDASSVSSTEASSTSSTATSASSTDVSSSSSTSESSTTHRPRYSTAITDVSSSASSTSGSTTTIAPSSSTDGSSSAATDASASSSSTSSSSDTSSISTDNYDVTTLLSQTASTNTDILFTATTTTAAGISGLTGTTVIPDIGTANPSTSITLVSSSLTVTVDPSTFTSAKTITSSATSTGSSTTVTLTQATAVSTSKITSESVSETTLTYNTVSESTTTKTVSYSNDTFTTTSTSTTIYATSVATYSSTVAVTTASVASSTYTTTATVAASGTVDLFSAIATDAVPTSFPTISNEWDFNDNVDWTEKSQGQTNKFYVNLLLDDAAYPAFVYPYLMWQSTSSLYGFAVQHTTSSDYIFDQYMDNGNPRIFTNPLNEYDLVFSSASFASSSDFYMNVSNLTASSTLVTLTDSSDTSSYVQLPIVEGMGFVTAIYYGDLIPSLYSGMNIQSLASETSSSLAEGVSKYRTYINDVAWLIYVTNPLNDDSFNFSTAYGSGNGYSIVGNVAVDGLIVQATVAPSSTDDEVYFDEAAGMYVTSMDIVGTSDGLTSTYYYNFQTEGASASGSPIVYILAHQLDAVSSNSDGANTGVTLAAVTRGVATAFLTASIEFTETLNTEIGWLPWSAQLGSTNLSYSADLIQQLATAAESELSVDIWTTIESLNSYYLGKVIDKYAYITLVCADIIEDSSLTTSALDNLKTAFNNLIADDGYFVYDDKFGGIITNNDWDSITDTSDDFGNSHYNDHHFHYGYIIHAAAVLGYVDSQNGGTWATDNKDWVNALIRDVANPSSDDTYFPVSRYFDWFTGHSWASGLYYDINGLDEESTSEDYNFLYGMKMWGQLIGDDSMQYRADTMIQIMTRALNTYFYFEDSNTIMPSEIIPNKVAGISFQNYLDYTTYFGDDISYIHGIHMLPLTPLSGQMRSEVFVTEEWDDILAADIDSASGGWKGILRLNQALIDPNTSYAFFSASDASDYLDDGMSLTWSLAFSGGLAYSLGLL